ncbi:hypothetical protein, partial [Streptomyces sp. WAC 01325]|uniref:hypothetical protein n=1 Tax=Streptomyces sp. WAC 01325 TaxID=2203202 RepID=UPI001C8E0CE9
PQMLASTVQFSNNDQPPITPNQQEFECTGAGIEVGIKSVPSDTQQRARPDPVRRSCVPRSEEQYWQASDPEDRPNNQRSTHELTTVDRLPT